MKRSVVLDALDQAFKEVYVAAYRNRLLPSELGIAQMTAAQRKQADDDFHQVVEYNIRAYDDAARDIASHPSLTDD